MSSFIILSLKRQVISLLKNKSPRNAWRLNFCIQKSYSCRNVVPVISKKQKRLKNQIFCEPDSKTGRVFHLHKVRNGGFSVNKAEGQPLLSICGCCAAFVIRKSKKIIYRHSEKEAPHISAGLPFPCFLFYRSQKKDYFSFLFLSTSRKRSNASLAFTDFILGNARSKRR